MVNVRNICRWIIFVIAMVVAVITAWWCLDGQATTWGFVAMAALYVAGGTGVVERL